MKKIAYTIIILVVVLGGIYLFKANQIKNVFDEMYYAEVKTVLGGYTSTSFRNMKVIENIPNNVREDYLPHQNKEFYKDELLKSNERMSIYFNKKEKIIKIIGLLDYSNDPFGEELEGVRYSTLYYMDSKKLVIKKIEIVSDEYSKTDYSTSDPKEIEKFMKKHKMTKEELVNKKKYFLYDKLLTDWFTYNPKSKFSLEDLGEIYVEEK